MGKDLKLQIKIKNLRSSQGKIFLTKIQKTINLKEKKVEIKFPSFGGGGCQCHSITG